MACLLENMINKAKTDGQTERLRDALNTAVAVKMDCEQRFQDDRGMRNENMCAVLLKLTPMCSLWMWCN